ncbi:MAG TPA: hypothetical protein VHE35_01950, partial [Kofleriaceae bacterium]|nr:hypothetical protein [Kofleriaceae bacterium]
DACLRAALAAAGDRPIGPDHLPSPLPRRRAAAHPSFERQGELVAIRFGAATVNLKDGDGLRYLAYLVERPGVDVHVLDLIAEARSGRALPSDVRARGAAGPDLGDAGPLLDARAKAAYQRRLADLRATVDEATSFGDHARAERARAEIEALAAELARAVGLGGRDRKASAAAERARVNVTLRLRGALKRIAAACPPLGVHLEASLRTGTFCSYQPVALAP